MSRGSVILARPASRTLSTTQTPPTRLRKLFKGAATSLEGSCERQCHAPMSTSTINNLAEHLNWLLRERPFVPPVRTTPPIPESSSATFPSSAQSTSLTREGELPQRHAPVSPPLVRANRPVEEVKYFAGQETIESYHSTAQPVDSSEKGESEDMARLRAVPGSGHKPSLLCQKPLVEAQTRKFSISCPHMWRINIEWKSDHVTNSHKYIGHPLLPHPENLY
jgi:hypothetical protein